MIRILSLGGGVQSTCILRMSLAGDLPPLDHVIFADTGAELPETYENVDVLEAACRQRGVGFHRVTNHYEQSTGNLYDDLMSDDKSNRWASPPLFIDNGPSVRPGQTKRQCTGDFKRDPINKKFRELCGIAPRSRGPKEIIAEQWLGIHAGEKARMKLSDKRWFIIWHPLIESFSAPMNNWDCIRWLDKNGYPIPPKSACYFCPYQSRQRWLGLHPDLRLMAVRLDKKLRHSGSFKGDVYLHPSLKPLDMALREDQRLADQNPQFDLDGFPDECHGVCGV